MNLASFQAEPIVTKADGAEVVKDVPFDEICTYISDGPDSKVVVLLAGLWLSREHLSKEQMLRAAVCALFPGKGYMRYASSTSAIMLANAAGFQLDLQNEIKLRWSLISERGCNEVAIGLSGISNIAEWTPFISELFGLSTNNDVRAALVKATSNLARKKHSPEIGELLNKFLSQMPLEMKAYANPKNFQFVNNLVTVPK